MQTLQLLLVLIYSFSAHAFTINESYLSGTEVCEINKALRVGEIEKWVEVPVDYQNPNGEKTLLYSYTKKPFNKQLPSVIYFTGGPGVSSRNSEFDLPNSNLIFFEQRGISCSRPKTKTLFLNPKFYSSENTAKDALRIIKNYGITSITSYGQSYGTIPATIFASLFPAETKALIIEGVIYEGNKSLWNSEVKRNLLQTFFNGLSLDKQERIINLSAHNFLPANWFSKLGGMILYLNDGIDVFNEFLDNVLNMDDEALQSFVLSFYPLERQEDVFDFGDVMMGMIGCQEISMNEIGLSMTLVFEGKKLVYDHDNVDREQRCRPLGLEDNQGNYYQAKRFQVRVPTFYLLGENDGATDLNQGKSHFQNVAKGKKIMLVMKKGGHLPSLSLLKDNRACDPQVEEDQCQSLKQNVMMVKIFEGILAHAEVDQDLVSSFNQEGSLFWSIQN